MKSITTSIYAKIAQAWVDKKRHIWIEGGTAASKTWSVLQLLYWIASSSKSPLLISCVSETMPHIKRGCLRDFQRILGDAFDINKFNKTDFIYSFNQAKLEFFSADDPSKQRGARRDILFLNELNNIPYDAYRELDARTRLCTIADWNPVSEFFFHEQQLYKGIDSIFIHATYRDALQVVAPEVIKNILEMGKRDPNWASVYLEGKLGKIEGLVYPFFEQIDTLPDGDVFYGLDFGFSNDPTVLTANVVKSDILYSQELIYERGLTNNDIAYRMGELGVRKNFDEIFADSAEPKSIEEIYQYGFNIKPTPKGPGSVEYGHQKIRQYKQSWTKDSVNCIKEQRNFRYIPDKNGKLTDKTTHIFSHGMDSLIAGTLIKAKRGEVKIEDVIEGDYVLTRAGWKRVLFSGKTSPAKEILTVTFSNGKSITGTSDHLIWLKDKGFTPLNTCRYADIIEVCRERQLSIMARNIIGILKLLIGQIGYILSQDQKRSDISIAKYGLTIMELFLKVARYTTRIITHLTMNYPILNVYLADGITSSIQPLFLNGSVSGCEFISGNTNKRLMNGISRLKAGNGIGGTESYLGKVERSKPISANNVGENTLPDNQIPKLDVSALTSVNPKIDGTWVRTILMQLANGVNGIFKRINIVQEDVVPVFVLSVSEPHKEKQSVYDLTTEDMPEFYANSILVHNSRRYAIMGKVEPREQESIIIYDAMEGVKDLELV